MFIIKKITWVLRAVLLKFFFGRLGYFSYLGKPLLLIGMKRMFIGHKFRLYPNARIEVYKSGSLTIGDNVAIGQNFHLIASEHLRIASGVLISANVLITDTDHTYSQYNVPIHEQGNNVKPTSIGKNCFLGYGAVIQAGTILGDNCIVGANATVKGIFQEGSIIVGSPGKVIKRRLAPQQADR